MASACYRFMPMPGLLRGDKSMHIVRFNDPQFPSRDIETNSARFLLGFALLYLQS
jgi:hypothetical protein